MNHTSGPDTTRSDSGRRTLAFLLIGGGIVLLLITSGIFSPGQFFGSFGEFFGSFGQFFGDFGRTVGQIAGDFGQSIGLFFGEFGRGIGQFFATGWKLIVPAVLVGIGLLMLLRRPAATEPEEKAKREEF